jgi:hypothetical protein
MGFRRSRPNLPSPEAPPTAMAATLNGRRVKGTPGAIAKLLKRGGEWGKSQGLAGLIKRECREQRGFVGEEM